MAVAWGCFSRLLDLSFCFWFSCQFVFAAIFDAQIFLPRCVTDYYPQMAKDILVDYCTTYKDPLMSDPPIWFSSLLMAHFIFQFLFDVPAVYAFWTGKKWIQIPAIIYAVQVLTISFPILSYLQHTDFYYHRGPAPHTEDDRAALINHVYLPWASVALLLLLVMLYRKKKDCQCKGEVLEVEQEAKDVQENGEIEAKKQE